MQQRIELVKGVRAQRLEVSEKKVSLSNGEEYRYGKLLISIGGYVVPLQIPGADAKNVLYMRTIEDADRIINAAKRAQKAVIIGGGFIGLEFASSFRVNGVSDVTLLVREDYYWKGKLNKDSSKVLQKLLEKNGVKVLVNEEAKKSSL